VTQSAISYEEACSTSWSFLDLLWNSVGLAICLKLAVCSIIIERASSWAIFDSTNSLSVGSSVELSLDDYLIIRLIEHWVIVIQMFPNTTRWALGYRYLKVTTSIIIQLVHLWELWAILRGILSFCCCFLFCFVLFFDDQQWPTLLWGFSSSGLRWILNYVIANRMQIVRWRQWS
jgi:hypothetical protein